MTDPSRRYHLAQVNIAKLRAPMDDPMIADFANNLQRINSLAEASPGFVWRLQDDSGNNTDMRPYADPLTILNMSVWESPEALHAYVYQTAHTGFLRRREEWMEKMSTPYFTMWWVRAGELPTVEDAKVRLEHLARYGESSHAFTFRSRFAPPGPVNYDGRVFRVRENASGEAGEGTTFHYRQQDDLVWGTYTGSGVRLGTLMATADHEGVLTMRYQQLNPANEWRTGECRSFPVHLPDGRLLIHENWRWTGGAEGAGTSVIEEIVTHSTATGA